MNRVCLSVCVLVLTNSKKSVILDLLACILHSILVSGKIPETGETSRVFFEILSLSRVFLSRIFSEGILVLSRVFSDILFLSRVF